MRPTPENLKQEIIQKYLEGYSIPEISKSSKVSVGTVHKIADEEAKKENELCSVREIAKMFKKEQLNLSEVISGVRLYNKVKNVGLTSLFFEDFLDFTNTESFRKELQHEQFLNDIMRILELEGKNNIKTENMPDMINEQLDKYKTLTAECKRLERSIEKLHERSAVTEMEIFQFKKEQEMFSQYKKDNSTYTDWKNKWMGHGILFEKAYEIMEKKFEPDVLYEKLREIYTNPHKNTSIIEKILSMDSEL
ncbi:MAG TPA: hypothetical protein VJ697_13295 [Nitrososphaeraceae archaeon]|nr:hypothetical protein [Nitrososphaeraceae archaeon]